MQIKLSKRGPVMWFLGNPKNLVASLTADQPGPVEIDFDSLDNREQQKIITDLRQGIIESDVNSQELYGRWVKSRPAVPEDPGETKESIHVSAQKSIDEKRKALQKRQEKEEKEMRRRCDYLVSQGVQALKAGLSGLQDQRLINMMIQTEQVGKARKGVLRFLRDKLKQSQRQMARIVNRKSLQQLKSNQQKETLPYNVVESEQETIVLTPEDLIAAATEKQ